MTEPYLTQTLANGLFLLASKDLRNLGNTDLAPFYEAASIKPIEFDSLLDSANAARSEAGLVPMEPQQFAGQVTSSNQFFIDFLEAAGLERVFTQDFTEDTQNPLITIPGINAELAAKYRDKINLSSPALAARLGSATFIQHIDDVAGFEVADSNSIVRERIRNIHGYLNDYLFT